MKKARIKSDAEVRRVYRKAREVDMEKFHEAESREQDTMIRSRQIAKDLGLDMKIGDVEYQGDGNKAIFYYIADNRVDFRQLIKVLADVFKVKIEMKQIGARQEAGRIGGIGPCGRALCCATFTTNFVSVSTLAARFQDISLNPQKLAGQCAKLKCCLNYEVDAYVEASKRFPPRDAELETVEGTYYFFKADIMRGEITYSSDKHIPANLKTITARRAKQIIEINKRGEKPETLFEDGDAQNERQSSDLLEQNSINRFDNASRNKKRRRGNNGNGTREHRGDNRKGRRKDEPKSE
jgi:cell fate regulator YaaT (PSP1 superfamily)